MHGIETATKASLANGGAGVSIGGTLFYSFLNSNIVSSTLPGSETLSSPSGDSYVDSVSEVVGENGEKVVLGLFWTRFRSSSYQRARRSSSRQESLFDASPGSATRRVGTTFLCLRLALKPPLETCITKTHRIE